MKPAPKIWWPYRVAGLMAALLIGFYFLQFYVAGKKFAGAVAALSRMSAAPQQQEAPHEPGVVPVKIIGEKKKE
jgi:hypothetical protein